MIEIDWWHKGKYLAFLARPADDPKIYILWSLKNPLVVSEVDSIDPEYAGVIQKSYPVFKQ